MNDDTDGTPDEHLGCDCEGRQLDLNKVMDSRLTEGGVTHITLGTVICSDFGERFRQLLKHTDPAGYARYREIKYPNGEDTLTPETAAAAMKFVFERAAELLLPHYLSHAVVERQQQS